MDSCILETIFQSTFPLQGTTGLSSMPGAEFHISIHVPIAGNDKKEGVAEKGGRISIHVPIAGNDRSFVEFADRQLYFNPRSHCRERPCGCFDCICGRDISIHVPIAGNDGFGGVDEFSLEVFQSTFPLQGTTGAILCGITAEITFQSTFPLQGTTFCW